MKRASNSIDLADFLASRAALQRQVMTSSNAAAAHLGVGLIEAGEEPAEKMRRMEEERGQKRSLNRDGDSALPSTTIELSAEEAIALGMIQGPIDGTFTVEDEVSENVIVQHMDIEEPLSTLRALLAQRLRLNMDHYEFWLQNQQILDPGKNLVEQCVQGEGTVQVNCEVGEFPGASAPRVNIVDILKPAEEVTQDVVPHRTQRRNVPERSAEEGEQQREDDEVEDEDKEEEVTRWVVDQHFRKEQERLGIPLDPRHWTPFHVAHWIRWAIGKFRLHSVDANEWIHITGQDIVDMSHEMFAALVPDDKDDIFWTHLELLRKCKFVAIVQAQPKNAPSRPTPTSTKPLPQTSSVSVRSFGAYRQPSLREDSPVHVSSAAFSNTASHVTHNVNNNNNNNNNNNHINNRPRSPRMSGFETRPPLGSTPISAASVKNANNGQIQLWQFLLELLTDYSCRDAIHWLGDEGEFKLQNPELVAQMWGQRKNKPTMNYDKLSRALRYYYDGDMITKVQGKRFVYKFVCDLKTLLGYSPKELASLVQECAAKKAAKSAEMRIRRSSLGLDTDGPNESHVDTDEDDGDDDAASIALQTAVNNLSQLSASGGHVAGLVPSSSTLSSSSSTCPAVPSSSSSSFPSMPSASPSTMPSFAASVGPRILVRRPVNVSALSTLPCADADDLGVD